MILQNLFLSPSPDNIFFPPPLFPYLVEVIPRLLLLLLLLLLLAATAREKVVVVVVVFWVIRSKNPATSLYITARTHVRTFSTRTQHWRTHRQRATTPASLSPVLSVFNVLLLPLDGGGQACSVAVAGSPPKKRPARTRRTTLKLVRQASKQSWFLKLC